MQNIVSFCTKVGQKFLTNFGSEVWERGSNENQNKLVRRHIPKGTDFDDKTQREVEKIEEWINNYPRRIFDYRTTEQLFEEELRKAA